MKNQCSDCSRYLSELFGTAILILVGVGSAVISGKLIGAVGIAFAFGLTLMLLAYSLGPVSGCHINPAVTLGMLFTGKIGLKDSIFYIISQLVGGVAGGYLVYLIATGKADFSLTQGFASNGFMDHSPEKYSILSCGLVEMLITAILIFVVLSTTTAGFAKGFGGLAVGGTLTAIHFVSIPVSNTSANIARSLGSAFFEGGWAIEQLWLFAIAHVLAAILAVIMYKIIYCE
jgi:aquaporin Z